MTDFLLLMLIAAVSISAAAVGWRLWKIEMAIRDAADTSGVKKQISNKLRELKKDVEGTVPGKSL